MASSMTRRNLESKVNEFFTAWEALRPDSSDAVYDRLGSLFDKDCIANPISMRESVSPRIGRLAVVEGYKELVREQRCSIIQRRIESQIVDEDQRIVSCEMKNRLSVNGCPLDPFHETAVLKYNAEGFIASLNMYSCRSPIMTILQKTTGLGPYIDVTIIYRYQILIIH